LKENGNPGLIDGYTRAAFLYFLVNYLAFKMRDEALKNQVKQIRTSRNVPCVCAFAKHRYFYQAFDIKENDGMFIAPENV
jgi:predicted metalloendopeptidase